MANDKGLSLLPFILVHLFCITSFLVTLRISILNEKTYRLIELKKCHQKVIDTTKSYLEFQLHRNNLLKKIFYLKKIPQLMTYAHAAEKSLIFIQEFSYFIFHKNINNIDICRGVSLLEIHLNSFFKRKIKFVRNSKNLLQEKKVTKLKLLSKKIPFFTKITFQIKNEKLKIHSHLVSNEI